MIGTQVLGRVVVDSDVPSLSPVCWVVLGGGGRYPNNAEAPERRNHAHPPTPIGGPSDMIVYSRPYVLNFLDRCVDIRACFFALSPTWVCFAPENVLLQVSCMVKSPFGATKKLPLVWILANC
jgi:hypothetical protein